MRAWQKPKRRGATAESRPTSQLMQPKIIVAIPAYNVGQFIADVVLKTRRFADEVTVVDDGSSDGTSETARDAGALVIRHGVNQGAGEATKSCFKQARRRGAHILVTVDGDGQHDPDDIPRLLAPILSRQADVVIGSRFLGRKSNMSAYRKFGIRVITWLFNLGSNVKVSDAQSCFRAYGERALQSLNITQRGFGFSVELLEQARQRGLTISEVPISCVYHSASHSSNPVIHGLGVALNVVKLRFKGLLHRLIGGNGAGNKGISD